MPYSVPRRRGHLATLGSSDSDDPLGKEEETGKSLRLLHSLPTNVIVHSASPSPPHKQQLQKGNGASHSITSADRMSPSMSIFGLPTPPHSHSNDDATSRRSATPDNPSKRLLRTTPRSNKRSYEVPGSHFESLSSASKRRAVQAETPRSVYFGPRPGEQSPSKGRTSPLKSLTTDALRRNLQPNRSDYDDDDDTCTKDRIVLLPTKRTRDTNQTRQFEIAGKTTDTDLPETSRRILFGHELRARQQREEGEKNQQPEPQHEEANEDFMQLQEQEGTPELSQASTGFEQQDSFPTHPQNASSPSMHVSTPLTKATPPFGMSDILRSSPRISSPAIHNATLNDIPLSPSQHRKRLSSSNQQPMESTPFRLGTKKVSGRKSTPHPGQEGRVRASMAALDSPRRARRVLKDAEELLQEQAAALSRQPSSHSSTFSREQGLVSSRPPERELSTILAYEQDENPDEDDFSHFTVDASRTGVDDIPQASKERDEGVDSDVRAEDSVQDESEEVLADDFVYETVIVEQQQQQQSMKKKKADESEGSASSRDSSPVLTGVQYNPKWDMNIDQAEVQRRQQQIEKGTDSLQHLQSRRNESAREVAERFVEELEGEEEEEEVVEEEEEGEEGEGEEEEEEHHLKGGEDGEKDKEKYFEEKRNYAAMDVEVDSQEEESTIEMEDEESGEIEGEKGILKESSEMEGTGDEESSEESEAEEEPHEETSHDEDGEGMVEESESEEMVIMQDMAGDELSEEELSADEEAAAEVVVELSKGMASKQCAPSTEVAEYRLRSLMAGNATRDQRLDSILMDSTMNNSLWRSFTDRTRLLTARPGAVEVSSMNRDNAARATAILTLFHKYVNYGVLDVEIDDEEIEASMQHHALAQETAALRQLLSQNSAGAGDKTLDEVLAEKEYEIKRTGREGRLQLPSTPLLVAATAGSPRTPLLPGAFPQASAKARLLSNNLHLSPEKISDKSFRHCPPSEVNLALFTRQNWRALESVVRGEIAAAARAIVAVSESTQEEARLQAALTLNQGHLAKAFLDAYKVSPSAQGQVKQWSKEKVQSKVASLVRTYLVSLQHKYPDLGIDADALADATFVGEVSTSSREKQKEVDDSGVAEASLRLPFQMVTESTPAPLSKPDAMQNNSLSSPSMDRAGRSDGINIYPRLPNPLPPFSTKWKRSDTSKMPAPAQSQEKKGEGNGDVSMGLTGLASKSLGYLYATMGWNKGKDEEAEAEVTERPAEVVKKNITNQAPARLSRSTLASSSTYDHSSLSFNRSQSQISYGTGSSRLIRSGGISSTVDPTALALLSPHTHQLAKAKVQQFKDSRRANNWRSPRHDRLATEISNSSMSRLR